MPTDLQPSDHQLARRVLDAFEREFWAGHHDRVRLIAAPLREIHAAQSRAPDPGALVGSLLEALEARAGL